ncbi:PIG-L deacetylase family protein [Actinoalloteichus spitiensis]|uniref:PIG-L deacetylase family protein n=1 Tax=Actinoalloteichus spitiensis TaxID=252394 RepID=UPI00068C8D93|nr:PIG-L deacetylase family protein [Actinoalloteichus spitiensis]
MSTGTRTAGARVARVLVVTAHPDDVDFGAAGTVASWRAAGVEVSYCVCTSGQAGEVAALPRSQVPALREREQRAAAAEVGVTDVTFLGYHDGTVTPSPALRRDITRVIRTVRPDRVVTHSPEINWARLAVSHPDHRAVGEATVAAVYPDSRNQYAHPELASAGLAAWTVRELWLTEAPPERVNHAVDITETFPHKMAALRAHASQTSHLADLETWLRAELAANGRAHGLGADQLAEVFQLVDVG